MDVGSLSAGVAALQTAIDAVKLARDSLDKLDKAELRLKLSAAIECLADAKVDAAEKKMLVSELQQEILQLNNRLAFTNRLEFDGHVLWATDSDTGQKEDHPYCPTCWQGEQKQVTLHRFKSGAGTGWVCKVCFKKFIVERSPRPQFKSRSVI